MSNSDSSKTCMNCMFGELLDVKEDGKYVIKCKAFNRILYNSMADNCHVYMQDARKTNM